MRLDFTRLCLTIDSMEPRYILRTTAQYTWATVLGLIAILVVVAQALRGGPTGMFGTVIVAVGLVILAIGAYALPYFEANAGGVVIANLIMRTTLPWAEIEDVNSRWGMTFSTKSGKRYAVRVFGASESSRWQQKAEKPDTGKAHSYEVGHRIPRIESGELSLRATTATATSLVHDFLAETSPGDHTASPSMTFSRTVNVLPLGLSLGGIALMVLGVILL